MTYIELDKIFCSSSLPSVLDASIANLSLQNFLSIVPLSLLSASALVYFDANAACTAGTSSSYGKIGGSGPSGVTENGLICL